MNRDTTIAVAVGGLIVILLAVALIAGGLTTTSTSTGSASATLVGGLPPSPPGDGSTGIVFDLRSQEGMSFLGLKLQSDKHYAHVGIVLPTECVLENASGVAELVTDGECAALPVRGELSGSGTSITGVEFHIVEARVSERCLQTLAVGDPWPAADDACDA